MESGKLIHPTPADILSHILEVMVEDQNKDNQPPLPVRTFSLIQEGVNRANEEHKRKPK